MSPLQEARLHYQPQLPNFLKVILSLRVAPQQPLPLSKEYVDLLQAQFPRSYSQPFLQFEVGNGVKNLKPLKVGVVLSGGQAPGGHNVIIGLFDALKKMDSSSQLFGFLDGPKGIVDNKNKPLTEAVLAPYRNQGGFDMIGSGRDKIETSQQFESAAKTVQSLDLDGLVVIGGDDSNTNAAMLAEYFLQQNLKCRVIGVPKTIDGDLQNEFVEISFGYDTACKVYAESIGNIARDALSAKKYYYFIKLMGRSASHITLEAALQTHPNITLIAEEVEANKKTLQQLVQEITEIIVQRASKGKQYGVVLIPEGIIEFIPEFKELIKELNHLLAPETDHPQKLDAQPSNDAKIQYIAAQLSPSSKACFRSIPSEIQAQLLLERDPHGNVQVSKIETERLFIDMVKPELKRLQQAGTYKGKFNAQPIFCGYEGRSGLPSNFDAQYCYALGTVAAILIQEGMTGYMSCVRNLTQPVEQWVPCGVPLVPLMHVEQRNGKATPVIRKALVDLQGRKFAEFSKQRSNWALNDEYCTPGPIQFCGPASLTESTVLT